MLQTKKVTTTKILLPVSLAVLVLPGLFACGDPCQTQDDGSVICGEFGSLLSSNWEGGLQWPAVATQRGSVVSTANGELVEYKNNGERRVLDSDIGWTASAPSLSSTGSLYITGADSDVQAIEYNLTYNTRRWSHSLRGDSPSTPPALGDEFIHFATTSTDREGRNLITVDADSGVVLKSRPDTSPAAVSNEGELYYLEGAHECGSFYDNLAAEGKDGEIAWRYSDPSGIRDFAPGPHGEVYVVTGDRDLVRVSSIGQEDWRFTPDCVDCNVAAAPTVTNDALYFPVWEGFAPANGCEEEPEFDDDYLDPLYALTHDGKLLWTYDGFDSTSSAYSSSDAMLGMFASSTRTVVRHHPSGRPSVAADGTLIVATDGAVVSLDSNGKELGRAMFDPAAGEQTETGLGIFGGDSLINNGPSISPLLGPDGSLYIWDGSMLRIFSSGKPAADIPWNAPFGGYRNAGRIGG